MADGSEAVPPGRTRRTFGPAVLSGLAAGALAAYAGSKPWVTGTGSDSGPGVAKMAWGEVTSSPLATALAFVVLACWGVVLVTRGRFRRAVAALALLAAAGYVATVAWAPFSLPDHLVEQVRRRTGGELDDTSLTGWFWLAALAALLLVASTALAVRWVPAWPAMGTRYDAPTRGSAPRGADEAGVPADNIDIWKALDEGRDPTA